MDIKSMDLKKVKIAYIVAAALLAVCAIISAYLHHQYIALGFIVLASAIIMAGAFFVSFLAKVSKIKDLD